MTITIKKQGYWCLRVIYTLCQGFESDGRNFLAAIVPKCVVGLCLYIQFQNCKDTTTMMKFPAHFIVG
jgi:hypothetical protein